MTAFAAYAPLGVPKPFGRDLWIVDGPEIAMRVAGIGVPFPTRMTLVRLATGGIWVHSPIALTRALAETIAALGPVAHLVAPNTLHWSYLADWHRQFPAAHVHLPPALGRRARRSVPPGALLGEVADAAWSSEIDQCLIRAVGFTEVAFHHRASGTLILTDLIENFEPARIRSRALRWLIRAAGAAYPDGKAPIDLRWSFIGRQRALRAAVARMIGWAPDRIVLAHGRCIARDGLAELRRAFAWAR